ncbi:PREDICTED: uncharacterized protein LOC104759750 [Camelina sativa]|uniref:Uncharacterized protein LOC104759750 n=1 Tax=Camelina sativa TaxID=90675 RepID=A0ABM0X5B3_CAMSA|nr:PREDICTED: uncharacterized protein LOC104759750 [Camelina sativa]
MPPKRGGKTAARVQPRVRAESPVRDEQPEVVHANVARAGEANEMAMFEQFRRFQEFMQREPNLRGAPEVVPPQQDAPHHDAPERVVPPQQPPPPPPLVQVQGPSYWEAMRNLKDMGMEPFGGKSNPIDADNWRKRLERNFDNARCPHEYRLDLAVQYLKDEALVWWEKVVDQAHGRYELTWADFKTEFSRKYFPREAMDRMEEEFLELRQGTMTVREYDREFDRLSRFAGRFMNEDELIRRFLRGLRIELKNRCEMYDYRSKIDLVEKAANLEIGLEKEMSQNKAAQARLAKGSSSNKRTWDATTVGTPLMCFGCNQPGHVLKDCTRTRTIKSCYECGQEGHIARFCPRKVGRQQVNNRPREQLPPPPKRQNVGPRVMMAETEEDEDNEPITGLVLVGGWNAYTLFYTGATLSCVKPGVTQNWSFDGEFIPKAKRIGTVGKEKLGSTGVHKDVPIMINGEVLVGILAEMEINHYDVILGMNWLKKHQAVLDCHRARVHLSRPEGKITFQGVKMGGGFSIISMMQPEELIEKGNDAFLATISVVGEEMELGVDNIPIVAEYADVFESLKGPLSLSL